MSNYTECSDCAKQLNEVVKGKKIVHVIANQNPQKYCWFSLDPVHTFCAPEKSWEYAKQYSNYLTGKKIAGAAIGLGGWGVYTYMYVGDRALMFGGCSYYAAGDKSRPKKHQLLLELEDGSALCFVLKFAGMLFLFKVDDNGNAINFSNSFPLILSDGFTLKFFMDLIEREAGKKVAKDFLATKNRIPGLGNDIVNEILWEAKISPKSKMDVLSREEYAMLYTAIKKVFSAVIDGGGKDIDKDLFGNYGKYMTRASKNTVGKPCSRCGDIIIKENNYIGSPIYYCPQCQPMKK